MENQKSKKAVSQKLGIDEISLTAIKYNNCIKMDVEAVDIVPTGKRFSSNTGNEMAVILRYEYSEVSWSLNNMHDEFIFPLKQVMKFKIFEGKVLISLREGFKKHTKLIHVDNIRNPSSKKPIISMSFLDKALSIIFTPCKGVEDNTLLLLGFTMQKLRFEKKPNFTQPVQNSQNVIKKFERTNQPELATSDVQLNKQYTNDSELRVNCVFIFRRHPLSIPFYLNLDQLLCLIENRVQTRLNRSRVYYINKKEEKMALVDDTDWAIAKWEVNKERMEILELYFT
ncbi:hypothetical protein G9A89_001007 [Geosiphon pyriformis]|nr:hypothetical protein G9A89_001007 [Geosiphon pyriformis]